MAYLPEMPSLIVAPLQPAEILPAYPLVQAVAPRVSLTDWQRFARRVTAKGRANLEGVTTVRHPGRAFPSGLCCWRRDEDLEAGRVLTAEHIIALDLLDPGPVIDALTVELERIAARLQCRSLRSVLYSETAPLADRLRQRGLRPAATVLTKPLHGPRAG